MHALEDDRIARRALHGELEPREPALDPAVRRRPAASVLRRGRRVQVLGPLVHQVVLAAGLLPVVRGDADGRRSPEARTAAAPGPGPVPAPVAVLRLAAPGGGRGRPGRLPRRGGTGRRTRRTRTHRGARRGRNGPLRRPGEPPAPVLHPVRRAAAALLARADEIDGDDGGRHEQRGDPGGRDEHPRTPGEPRPPRTRPLPRPAARADPAALGRDVRPEVLVPGVRLVAPVMLSRRRDRSSNGRSGLGRGGGFDSPPGRLGRRGGRGRRGGPGRVHRRGRPGRPGRSGRRGRLNGLNAPRRALDRSAPGPRVRRPRRRPSPGRVRDDPPPVHLHQLVPRRPADPREPLDGSELVRHRVPVAVPVQRRRTDVQLSREHAVATPRTSLQILEQGRELHGLRRRHDGAPFPRAPRNGVPEARNPRRSP